jgi:hypothetical protein
MIAVTSATALRTRALPRWLAFAGFALALLLLLGFAVMPLFAWPIWVGAVAFTMRSAETEARIPESVA